MYNYNYFSNAYIFKFGNIVSAVTADSTTCRALPPTFTGRIYHSNNGNG